MKRDGNIIWNLQTTHAMNEKHCWIFQSWELIPLVWVVFLPFATENTLTESRLLPLKCTNFSLSNRDALESTDSTSTRLDCTMSKSLPIPNVYGKLNFKEACRRWRCLGISTASVEHSLGKGFVFPILFLNTAESFHRMCISTSLHSFSYITEWKNNV